MVSYLQYGALSKNQKETVLPKRKEEHPRVSSLLLLRFILWNVTLRTAFPEFMESELPNSQGDLKTANGRLTNSAFNQAPDVTGGDWMEASLIPTATDGPMSTCEPAYQTPALWSLVYRESHF